MPRFSVIMPVYDRSHLVLQAIQSILDQTFEDFEFVIVDDGSRDGTWKVLSDAAQLDKRIKIFKLKFHSGIVPAFNECHRQVMGEIIIKQDSDDLSYPNRLEVIDQYFKNEHPDFLYHAAYQGFFDDSQTMMRRAFKPALPIEKDRLLKEQYIPGCFAYTRKFIQETPYRNLKCNEDWMLILDAYLKQYKISFVNQGLYEYFLQEDSNSMIFEGTGVYQEDEAIMRDILHKEYAIKDFHYAFKR